MENNFLPAISVVMPCRNERAHIAACVRSILRQENVPGGFEVLVVDGMSDDGTREILSEFAAMDDRLKLIDNPQRITSCAFNAGIRHARGRFIALLGAHNVYAADYLRSCLAVTEGTGADNVGGSMICRGESWLQKAIAASHHSGFSAGGARWHDFAYEGPADTVFGGFYRAEVFAKIGVFDETLVRNQDDELNLRLTRAGGRIWQSPLIKSWYYPRSSLSALFRQYLQYGYWKVKVIQKHHLPASIRHLVPGAFAASLLGLPLLAVIFPVALWLWLAILGLYLCSSLVAAALVARAQHWSYIAVLPAIFACYHFAYGLGFLLGIVDFVALRRGPAALFVSLTRTPASTSQRS
jgi:glycosyltransferase involved in cell wall biosynthesis